MNKYIEHIINDLVRDTEFDRVLGTTFFIPKTDIYTYLVKPFKEGKSTIRYEISSLGDLVFKKV